MNFVQVHFIALALVQSTSSPACSWGGRDEGKEKKQAQKRDQKVVNVRIIASLSW